MTKKPKPKKQRSRSSRRRWLVYGLIVFGLVVAVALYETRQELGRQQGHAGDQREYSESERNDRGRSDLRSYYRSHDLPPGWELGGIEAANNLSTIRIALHFAPGIVSQRHGEAARPGEMTATTACPTERAPWDNLKKLHLEITIADKTGLIDTFECTAPEAKQGQKQ